MSAGLISGLCIIGLFVTVGPAAPQEPAEILNRARDNIKAQLAKSANYTCVQTIERTYFENSANLGGGCQNAAKPSSRKPVMHDRLRLDVAVSEGQEIYSWHGENKFSSSTLSDIVRTGPISSGGFVGYLHNIFLSSGISFEYSGKSSQKIEAHRFSYVVPAASTQYGVQTQRGLVLIPFHGSFTVNAADYQLESLQVIADDIPADSNICAAETDVNYQLAHISGRAALIPSSFILQLDDDIHVFTTSRSEYTQCREFRGESVLHFDMKDTPADSEAAAPALGEWLPAGISLHLALRTPIDDQTSYTGDPVDAVLVDSVKIPGTEQLLPKNTTLHGIITKLEFRQEPWKHHLVSVQFNQVDYGKSFLFLRALPKPSKKNSQRLADVYGARLPGFIEQDYREGTFVFTSTHVHLDQRFSAEWLTRKPEKAALAENH